MEFEDQEEQDGEVGMELSCHHDDLPGNPKMLLTPPPPAAATGMDDSSPSRKLRYKECLKNHAVGIGGHALDGCGEFIAAGDDGTLDSLKCAACNCHRNFHRKENEPAGGGGAFVFHHQQQLLLTHHQHHHNPHGGHFGYRGPTSGYLHLGSPQQRATPLLALPSSSGGGGGGGSRDDLEDYYYSNPNSSSGKKRFRTKFTPDQKDKMLGFAERLGWRIQKQDEEIVQQFCNELGIKRHVLKVWMHNNKHTLGKKT